MIELGQPLELDPDEYPCLCVGDHRPTSRLNHAHHVLPLAWGGPDEPDNRVPLCPTGHAIVHVLLRDWVRAGRQLNRGYVNRYLYGVAAEGWARRPPT